MTGRQDIVDSRSDGPAVELVNADARADILLICEHASNRIPLSLNDLGLDRPALESHIAWDPGAAQIARFLSRELDATLILQRFSRLVYDCNRSPQAADAILSHSDSWSVPNNEDLPHAERETRIREVYFPFRDRIAETLNARIESGRTPALVTIHSFTPVFAGRRRDLDLGILHDSDHRLADVLLDRAARDLDLTVRRNQPYGPEDGVTHTLAVHAIPRGLLNVMLEIRNDLVADAASQRHMAERLATCLTRALAAVGRMAGPDRALSAG